MASSSIRDLLTSFSPDLHLFAISSGDGRIKVFVSPLYANADAENMTWGC